MAYINKINVDGVEYEVQDENALPAADLPDAINTALAQAKESGEFDGAQGETGPQGPAGESGVYVGTDTPPEGTKVWINPNGVATFPMPTADDAGKVLKAKGANEAEWGEATRGGGSEMELIFELTTTEEVHTIETGIDVDEYDEIYALCNTFPTLTDSSYHFDFHFSGVSKRIQNSLHNTQRRTHIFHATRCDARWRTTVAYAVSTSVDPDTVLGYENRISNNTIDYGDQMALSGKNFSFGVYAYHTADLVIGTHCKVYGRKRA